MLDIKGNSSDTRSVRLSNFTDRPFIFRNVSCRGIEGILQALKCSDVETQKEICALSGREAKRRGNEHNNWKETQVLWWNGEQFGRSTREYQDLISAIYDAVYEQDRSFEQDLHAIGNEEIRHTIGSPDMRDTVLTEIEMLYQLNRLRFRALRGHL